MEFKSKLHRAQFIKKVQDGMGKLPNRDVLLEFVRKGWSQQQIADKYEVTRQSVCKALKLK